MKKLLFLSIALIFSLVSANVFGQNTGITPTPGSTFTYHVVDNGNTYKWRVTKGDLETTAGVDAVVGTDEAATTTIQWKTGLTTGSVYYVHLLETNASSCSNEKVLKVTISESQFYLAIAANQTSPACYDGAVTVSLSNGDPNYSHGKATVNYTITPTGLGSATGYSFNIGDVLSQTTNFASVASVTSGNATISSGLVTVTNTSAVTIKYEITNSNLYTNTTDASGTTANFRQTVNLTSGVTSLGVTANTGTGVYTNHTDVARPATGAIGYN
jgi:hypothetical protein